MGLLGGRYASERMVQKVKECIRRFPNDSVIIPHRLNKECGIDENQAVTGILLSVQGHVLEQGN